MSVILLLLPILLIIGQKPTAAQEPNGATNPTTDQVSTTRTAPILRGDSLDSFLKRHGITSSDLRLANPDLKLSELEVGSELQLPKYSSGNLSPDEQLILDRIEADEQRKKQALHQAFENDRKRWGQCYGLYQYDWLGWKKAPNGTWVTDRRRCMSYSTFSASRSFSSLGLFEPNSSVAVTCKGLKISELSKLTAESDEGWSSWKLPRDYEKAMIAKLCARELK